MMVLYCAWSTHYHTTCLHMLAISHDNPPRILTILCSMCYTVVRYTYVQHGDVIDGIFSENSVSRCRLQLTPAQEIILPSIADFHNKHKLRVLKEEVSDSIFICAEPLGSKQKKTVAEYLQSALGVTSLHHFRLLE